MKLFGDQNRWKHQKKTTGVFLWYKGFSKCLQSSLLLYITNLLLSWTLLVSYQWSIQQLHHISSGNLRCILLFLFCQPTQRTSYLKTHPTSWGGTLWSRILSSKYSYRASFNFWIPRDWPCLNSQLGRSHICLGQIAWSLCRIFYLYSSMIWCYSNARSTKQLCKFGTNGIAVPL